MESKNNNSKLSIKAKKKKKENRDNNNKTNKLKLKTNKQTKCYQPTHWQAGMEPLFMLIFLENIFQIFFKMLSLSLGPQTTAL